MMQISDSHIDYDANNLTNRLRCKYLMYTKIMMQIIDKQIKMQISDAHQNYDANYLTNRLKMQISDAHQNYDANVLTNRLRCEYLIRTKIMMQIF